ncbi:MAG: hypothetical protein U9R34_05400 [Nanoarchaeota archaeon]|nr:hypothetical protein [Nanoarchaeota archaeon]
MENKTLDILIVEDDLKHLTDAKAEMQKRIEAGIKINVNYASNLADAMKCTSEKQYHGIISDIFFPTGYESEDDKEVKNEIATIMKKSLYCGIELANKALSYISTWENGSDDNEILAPIGVNLAEQVKDTTQFIFCTSTYHHGAKTQAVFEYARQNKIALIDANPLDLDGEDSSKNWSKAYQTLIQNRIKEDLGKIPSISGNFDEVNNYRKKFNSIISDYRLESDEIITIRATDDALMEEQKRDETEMDNIWI